MPLRIILLTTKSYRLPLGIALKEGAIRYSARRHGMPLQGVGH
jgi:hypothetical protein